MRDEKRAVAFDEMREQRPGLAPRLSDARPSQHAGGFRNHFINGQDWLLLVQTASSPVALMYNTPHRLRDKK